MILYHGSNQKIESIDLNICKPNKDFGRGFYLTDIKQQAIEMAKRRTRIVGVGEPIITTYELDDEILDCPELNIKIFDKPNKEWALFILKNRYEKLAENDYDIVIGPIADDGVTFQLERYANQLITLDTLVEELIYKKLNRQYFFGTIKGISYLKPL